MQGYIKEVFAKEDDILKRVRNSAPSDIAHMSLSADEAKILAFLVNLVQAKKVIEIGSFVGYSTIWLVRALPDGGELITIERDEKHFKIAKENLKEFKNVTLIEGDAIELLSEIKGPFDLIFIDANKISYPKYLDWAENHIRKGGLIIGDNSFLKGAVYDSNKVTKKNEKMVRAMQEFNHRLSDPEK